MPVKRIYLDEKRNVVDKDKAVLVMVRETDNNGKLLSERVEVK